MDYRSFFVSTLPLRANLIIDRSVLICSFLKKFDHKGVLSIGEICHFFEEADLARPNSTVLMRKMSADKRVSVRARQVKALHAADMYLEKAFPELFTSLAPNEIPAIDRSLLSAAPFIDQSYRSDLSDMARLYEALHVLENSMRRLIQAVLERKLGKEWWDVAASNPMQKKHKDRLEKENTRKWLPSRATTGPLYSLDWSDLITLIRKYEADFLPFVGEIDFMHRYADLGLLRHVVAHHGFIEDNSEFQRIALALRDWNSQVGPLVRKEFP
ncbi:hypothetical protein ACFQU1_10980 [Chelatococcus sp. GCM10030263]|uniref:hypothetical protein n=1 Tax=Chelatococcus sp. GCM10030263 TaxID=3273387 RepID=UPI0036115FD8